MRRSCFPCNRNPAAVWKNPEGARSSRESSSNYKRYFPDRTLDRLLLQGTIHNAVQEECGGVFRVGGGNSDTGGRRVVA